MKPDICIYHGNCADGFAAAWAVWKRWPNTKFVPGIYGSDPPDVEGKHVLMVDFSYKRAVLEAMSAKASTITVLDHHKTAQADLEGFAVFSPVCADTIDDIVLATQPGLGNIRAVFDMAKSGAMLAWEFCHPGAAIPAMVEYVQDRDLWKFELPHSRLISACLFSHPYDFNVWDGFARGCETAIVLAQIATEGAAIERKHHKDLAELIKATKRTMIIGGYAVPVANLPYTMSSDAGNAMARNERFAACYWDSAKARVFSLRSVEGGMDVSAIAAGYGGGGHKHAAGFQMPIGWEGDIRK